MTGPLAICPAFIRNPADLDMTVRTIETLRKTEPELDLLVVDDCSPAAELIDALAGHCEVHRFELTQTKTNGGFSRAVNVGLRRAHENHRDAVLVNADMQFVRPWVSAMRETTDSNDNPAAVVGALLIYEHGLIQHAGIFMSLLSRGWLHWYQFAPYMLPEAHAKRVCPVTGALQYIRWDTLDKLGLYPEGDFRLGWEDVCYCLDVFEAGMECVYQPDALAVHHESMFRGRVDDRIDKWQQQSWAALQRKHGRTNVNRFLHPVV